MPNDDFGTTHLGPADPDSVEQASTQPPTQPLDITSWLSAYDLPRSS